ncbi:MAG TPA: DUF4097 family beta strand repeat-containing protein [Planctomycetota bacterium]|nr:DUF4097 family beta strand repeat-containing protein [Planctomycetota bacterium]
MKLARMLVPAALLLPACVFVVGGDADDGWEMHGLGYLHDVDWGDGSTCTVDGQSVRVSDDGVVEVDGVELHHQRWVDVTAALGDGQLFHASTASGPIELHGVDGPGQLSVLLHSEIEGDGSVVLEDGKLEARDGQGKVFLDAVRGSLPRTLELSLSSGIGQIELRDFGGGPHIQVENGTGEVLVADCSAPAVELKSGTGDVRVERGQVDRFQASIGTSDLTCQGGHFGDADVQSGTGDVSFLRCEIGHLQASAGTGDVILDGGSVDRLNHELGTGGLQLRGGVRIGS